MGFCNALLYVCSRCLSTIHLTERPLCADAVYNSALVCCCCPCAHGAAHVSYVKQVQLPTLHDTSIDQYTSLKQMEMDNGPLSIMVPTLPGGSELW